LKSRLKIRALKKEEITQHLFNLNKCYRGWGDREKWERNYLQQPDFDINKNVIVIEENGELIAGVAAWFRNFVIRQRKTRASIFGDSWVLSEHRGRGLYSTLMKEVIELSRENKIALGFGVVSTEGVPFKALPQYGFDDIFYPQTKIKILRPERFLGILERKRTKFFERFEGTKFKIIVEHETRTIERRFLVKRGILKRFRKNTNIDVTIKSDIKTLFELYTLTTSLKCMLISAIGSILRKKIKMIVSLRFILRIIRSWVNDRRVLGTTEKDSQK